MASSAFTFHCMICFEEFDPLTNYPVVLPCGHTYVCIACANRLDKCMECREPLVTKIEVPSPSNADPTAKENVGTPGRYSYGGGVGVSGGGGHRLNYSQQSRQHHARGKYGQQQQQQRPPPKTFVTQRLPLPKNAVLLSLIQASEPARRRHREEQDANKFNNNSTGATAANLPPALPSSHSDDDDTVNNNTAAAPQSSSRVKFHKSSPLFVDGNASPVSTIEHMGSMLENDDEEHKIRVGTYLEGGPCGTYAVAVKDGLVVYPTLFEHSLQNAQDMDGVSRDVENMVKNSYRNKLLSRHKDKMALRGGGGKNSSNSNYNAKGGLARSASCANNATADREGGESSISVGTMAADSAATNSNIEKENSAKNTAEITLNYDAGNNLNTSGENLAVEAQFTMSKSEVGDHRDDESTNDPTTTGNSSNLHRGEAMSDPGGSSGTPVVSNSLLKCTLQGGAVGQTKKKQSLRLPINPSSSPTLVSTPTESKFDISDTTNADPALSATLKLRRQFSLGSGNLADDGEAECERSLIRLKYGDRVQVVSMDSRGWVKLARGYGYIRLEHEKQLVKVGGTSDKACQIEAMLHELSLERNKLKHEQKKLEHLSAGLMIDLQCSLLTSDDTVIVHAPEELPTPLRLEHQTSHASRDDLDIKNDSMIRKLDIVRPQPPATTTNARIQRHEIRTAKSHSPGRKNYTPHTPPSPPYNQTTPGGSTVSNYAAITPTRVNFRTGLSGHRALTSSYSHPHDFIHPISRTMSNHAGIGAKKSSSKRSIY